MCHIIFQIYLVRLDSSYNARTWV